MVWSTRLVYLSLKKLFQSDHNKESQQEVGTVFFFSFINTNVRTVREIHEAAQVDKLTT